MSTEPILQEFRLERQANNVLHFVFDSAGRSMNVFSNIAIHELGAFAAWLKTSDVAGVVVRSGKSNAFCAGADLSELGAAYDMIMAAPVEARTKIAADHFFPLSLAIRSLETAGKPVAAAIEGLALGGGCELAMGTHHRVLSSNPRAALGLPESVVGLLPGAGGTQRLPRLVGVEAALPILLEGARLSGTDALQAGLVDELAAPEDVVAAAERWVLSAASALQPWDKPHFTPGATNNKVSEHVAKFIQAARKAVLAQTLGHEPAQLAILDCIEQGYPLGFDDAIRAENRIFSHLIQRREPRNMIRAMFLGKSDAERAKKSGGPAPAVSTAVAAIAVQLKAMYKDDSALAAALARAGFKIEGQNPTYTQDGGPDTGDKGYWFESPPESAAKRHVRAALADVKTFADRQKAALSDEDARQIDYLLIQEFGFPAYLGGVFGL